MRERRALLSRSIAQRQRTLVQILHVQCFCVVFFPFIVDSKFVGRTSRGHPGGRSHIIFHPPSFCGACLNFLARRIQHSFPSSTVTSNFVYQRFNRSQLVGHFIFIFYFLVRKIPFTGIELTSQRVRRLRGYL